MNIATPLVALCLVIVGWFRKDAFLLYLAFIFLAFGSLSIIPAALLHGTTVLASSLAFLLVSARVMMRTDMRRQLLSAAIQPSEMGLLLLFMVLAIVWAMTMPRLMSANIYVYPMNSNHISYPEPLRSTSANFNQSINQIISGSTAIAFFLLARSGRFSRLFLNALIAGGTAVVVTGLADMVGPHIGLGPVLASFRTAAYMILSNNEVMGVSRVIGMMPEASSFGSLSVAFGALLLFTRHAYAPKLRYRVVLPLAAACLLLAALSTSTAAFLALGITFVLYCGDLAVRLAGRRIRRTLVTELLIIAALALIAILWLALFPAERDFIFRLVDVSLFKKNQSDSYVERMAWSHQALEAFTASHGIGIGVGSARTSNFFVNILASTGVLGTAIFAAFLARVFFARMRNRDDRQGSELARGGRLALLVIFTTLFAIGTTPDYGLLAASLFGTITGLTCMRAPRKVTKPLALPVPTAIQTA